MLLVIFLLQFVAFLQGLGFCLISWRLGIPLPPISSRMGLAWDYSSNAAGLGWILQDPATLGHSGGGAEACVMDFALQAELSACLWGLRMVIRRGFSSILLFKDSAVLVDLLLTSQEGPVAVSWALQELRDLISSLAWFSARKVSRQCVRPAHLLATSTRRRHLIRHRF